MPVTVNDMRSVARILVLGNGAAGAEKQALALATRLQDAILRLSPAAGHRVPVERVDAAVRGLARALPPPAHVLAALAARDAAFGYDRAALERSSASQHITDRIKRSARGERSVVIGCGRSTVALCALLKRADPLHVFNVQVQHPRAPFAWFDAVIAPRHDFPSAQDTVPGLLSSLGRLVSTSTPPENALLTSGTVHDITPARLDQQLRQWRSRLEELTLGRPKRVVWLVGGPCRGFPFSTRQAEAMADEVALALAAADAATALLVTFSRRTPLPVRQAIRQRLATGLPLPGQLVVWDGTEAENPFLALLASAAAVLATPDSISMATEAVAAGRPVLMLQTDQCRGKFARFHCHMRDEGWTRLFEAGALRQALDLDAGKADRVRAVEAWEALEREMEAMTDALVAKLIA